MRDRHRVCGAKMEKERMNGAHLPVQTYNSIFAAPFARICWYIDWHRWCIDFFESVYFSRR